MRSAILLAAVWFAAATSSAWPQSGPAFEPSIDAIESLPDRPGREETFGQCSACHGLAILRRQGLSRTGWDDIMTMMVDKHGMQRLDANDRAVILDYLTAAFPPQASPRGGWRNPFTQ